MFRSIAMVLAILIVLPLSQASALPPAGEEQIYKGVTLIGTTDTNRSSKDFFRLAGRAIDMVRSLSKADRNHGDLIQTVIYDPPSPNRTTTGVNRNIVAVYTLPADDSWPAPIIMYKSAKYASSLELALSLVGNAFHAKTHKQRAALRADMEASNSRKRKLSRSAYNAKLAEWKKLSERASGKMAPDEIIRDDCKIQLAIYNALRILHPEDRNINARAARLTERNCWDG